MHPQDGATYVPQQPEQGFNRARAEWLSSHPGADAWVPAGPPRTSTPDWSEPSFATIGDARNGFPAPDEPAAPPTGRWGRTAREPGLPGWAAILLLLVIAGIGGLIDESGGSQIKGGFAWGLIAASLIAILVVRRSQMFGVVIAPPLVYFVASAGMLYLRSGGLHNRKVLIDAASNWLVYGFPAIAGATAVVLLIAGVRMIVRR